jgi:hypothetical protein
MRTSKLFAAAGVITTGLLLVTPTLASAHPKPPPTPVVKSSALAAPFNLALNHGNVYVADGGLNLVGKLKSDRSIKTIAADQTGASGIATSKDGRYLAFTTTVSNPDTFENTASGLNIWGPRGKRVFADTHAYEEANNPDKINHYGVTNPSQCVIDAFNAAGFPYDYNGQKDSHAYSVTAFKDKWIVADAGANALWKIDNKGKIRTLAVLPPQPTTITADMATALGFPDCVVGITYNFEPVPTDVEVGKDGYLYVTTLPGGPESPVLGARGKVWKVNPYTGKAWVIARGFLGATNLAIGKYGEIYVSELFGGEISVVRHGKRSSYVSLPGVVAVETSRSGELWAATLGNEDPPAPGTIVKIVKRHAYKQATVKP